MSSLDAVSNYVNQTQSLKQEFFVKQFFKPTVWKCFVICEILPHGHNTIDTFKEKADSHHPTGKIVNDQNIGL